MSQHDRIVDLYVAAGMRGESHERYRPMHQREAASFAGALLGRREVDVTEEAPAVDLLWALVDTVPDPHDWDHVGSVIAVLDYVRDKTRGWQATSG